MNKTVKLLSILMVAITSYTSIADNQPAPELIIENVTLISPERSKPLRNASVWVKDGLIAEISIGSISRFAPIKRIDATGQFLIPGLMDSHVHLSNMPGLPFGAKDSPTELTLLQQFLKQQPKSYLYFGVTQLLDPSQSAHSISQFKRAEIKPDVFHCGSVPILNGYPALFAKPHIAAKMFPYYVQDESTTEKHIKGLSKPSRSAKSAIQKMAKDGARCVKIYIEDGFGKSNDWPLISEALIKQVIREAKSQGLLVLAHANAIDMQAIAEKHSVDVITHGLWNWLDFDGKSAIPKPVTEHLDRIIDKKIIVQPTLNVMDTIKGLTIPYILDDPLYNKVVSNEALDWYKSEQGQWYKKRSLARHGNSSLSTINARYDRIISQGERALLYLYHKGHPMVLASDTPSSPTYAAQPGLSTYRELQHMAKIGISLKDILSAATINNAKTFNMDQEYGTIEPGKIANLLLLRSNPLESISAYYQINKIFLHGSVIERESLEVRNDIK